MSVLRRRETDTLLNLRTRLLSKNKEEIERRRQTTLEKSNIVPDEMARVVTTSGDPAVAPLVNVDAIAFELGCFGVSGASTLLPFCVKD
jgi:hypothetical protein